MVIGIDVGAKGALCLIKNGKVEYLIPFKTIKSYVPLLSRIKKEKNLSIYVEEVHSMPRQGVKSMFSFGQRLGEIIGCLETLELEYKLVKPQQWQKEFFKKTKVEKNNDNTKEQIANIIYNRFMYLSSKLIKRTGRINTDLTDAIAISYTYMKGE